MSSMLMCPENFPLILGHEPAASNAIVDTSDAVCLKNAAGCLIVVLEYTAGGDTDLVLTVHEGATAAVAAAGTNEISATFPIWTALTPATTDIMTRQTDAAGYTIDATPTLNVIVAMYISASILTATYDWIALGTSGGNGANYASVLYILDKSRFKPNTTAIA